MRETQPEDRGEASTSRHPDDEHASRMRAVRAAHGAHLRGDDRRFAATGGGALVEPVPAAPAVRRLLLTRQQDQPALIIGESCDAGRGGDLFRCLPAAMQQHEQRSPLPWRVAARHIDEIIARRPNPGRNRDPASQRELAAVFEASGLRRFAAEELHQQFADTIRVRWPWLR